MVTTFSCEKALKEKLNTPFSSNTLPEHHEAMSLFTLGFKMHFGDLNPNKQPDHLCSDFITAYVTSARGSKVSDLIYYVSRQTSDRFVSHELAKKTKMIQELINLHGLFQPFRSED